MLMQINSAVEYFKIKISVATMSSYKIISASQFSLSMTFVLARNGSKRTRSADEYTGAKDCRGCGGNNCRRHCRRLGCRRKIRRLSCRHCRLVCRLLSCRHSHRSG
jgi:hypothetical protein